MKLSYFDLRGIAERTRYVLTIAGVDYEDDRFSFSFGTPGDFSTLKRPEFDAAKASGALDVSMGKLPILETDNGFRIAQSKAIERYVAKKCGMMGSNDEEAAFVDMLTEHQRDIQDGYKTAKAKNEAEIYLTKTLPESLQNVEKALTDTTGPYLTGDKPTLADVCFFVFITEFFDDKEAAAKAAATAPRVKAAVDAIAALPAVQKWKASRPDTIF